MSSKPKKTYTGIRVLASQIVKSAISIDISQYATHFFENNTFEFFHRVVNGEFLLLDRSCF